MRWHATIYTLDLEYPNTSKSQQPTQLTLLISKGPLPIEIFCIPFPIWLFSEPTSPWKIIPYTISCWLSYPAVGWVDIATLLLTFYCGTILLTHSNFQAKSKHKDGRSKQTPAPVVLARENKPEIELLDFRNDPNAQGQGHLVHGSPSNGRGQGHGGGQGDRVTQWVMKVALLL